MITTLVPLISALLLLGSRQVSAQSCPLSSLQTLSCHNTTVIDTCCTNYPGGLLVLTQFWDTLGPSDAWTPHGLWPDYCSGNGFPSFCDPSRYYSNLGSILASRDPDLKATMDEVWLDNRGNNERFWSHEWQKHGTCLSTLEPRCGVEEGDDAVEYFGAAIGAWRRLKTYDWLERCGIVPDARKTYTLKEIQDCLTSNFGAKPQLKCKGKTLHEAWYYHYVRGRVGDGVKGWEPEEANGRGGCPERGIRYPPK